MDPNKLVPTIDTFLNPDSDNPEFAFVIIVCQTKGNMAGGNTDLFTNMNSLSAMHLLLEAADRIKEREGRA